MYIKAHVIPNSRKQSIEKENEVNFRIKVKEPAERNLANNSAMEILRKYLSLRKEEIKLVSGHRASNKKFEILLDKT